MVSSGLSVGAKLFLGGSREGSTVLYKAGQYPLGAIGPVKFMWRPTVLDSACENAGQGDGQTDRQLWLWAHPAFYAELLQEIKLALNGDITETSQREETKRTQAPSLKDLHTGLTNPVVSDGHVTVTSLKDTLVRFTLTGPESNAILADALQVADVEPRKSSDSGEPPSPHRWWQDYYSRPAAQEVNRQQRALWDCLRGVQSPGQLPPRHVFGLTVRDPRLLIPAKKSRISEKPEGWF